MIIDIHVHPLLYKDICENPESVDFRKKQFGVQKQSPYEMDEMLTEMDWGGIDKAVLLPLDLTTRHGDCLTSNDEIKKLVELKPDRFIGFASVDPFRKDAVQVLEHAFKDLGLKGLKLNPSKQKFYPGDDLLKPLYKKCLEYNKPIIFHAGMSWEPDAPAKYSQPIHFEDVAIEFPELKICLAHFGWPWIYETIMLLLKYPNVYTDTSMLYMDSPVDFYGQVFQNNMKSTWLDNNFNSKVMFGSNGPRFRAAKLKPAIESLNIRKSTLEKLFSTNAINFLGLED